MDDAYFPKRYKSVTLITNSLSLSEMLNCVKILVVLSKIIDWAFLKISPEL